MVLNCCTSRFAFLVCAMVISLSPLEVAAVPTFDLASRGVRTVHLTGGGWKPGEVLNVEVGVTDPINVRGGSGWLDSVTPSLLTSW